MRGTVWPKPRSPEYTVRIEYWPPLHPRVIVEDPPLRPRTEGGTIPHSYSDPLRPCLYWPRAQEWTPDQLIAEHIVPWLMLWLFFYEAWLSTGIWSGEGVDHAPAGKPEPEDDEPEEQRPTPGGRGRKRRRTR